MVYKEQGRYIGLLKQWFPPGPWTPAFFVRKFLVTSPFFSDIIYIYVILSEHKEKFMRLQRSNYLFGYI